MPYFSKNASVNFPKLEKDVFDTYASYTPAMLHRLFQIIIISSLMTSCIKQTESITPLAKTLTLAELQREALMNTAAMAGNSELSNAARASLEMSPDPTVFYLNIKYNMKNIDVFEAANMPNTFEQIGHSFLQTLARFVLSIGGPQQVDINDIELSIPDLNLDRDVIKSIKIKRIFLQYNQDLDLNSDFAANFSFIDSLELTREVTVPQFGKVHTLFLSYRKVRNFCMYKCIQFDILEDDVIDILKPNTNVLLKPSLSIASLPAVNELKLDGQIELQIGLKLPF